MAVPASFPFPVSCRLRIALPVVLLLLLTGCTSGGMALRDSLQSAFGAETQAPALRSDLSYLRVGHSGQYAYLVLGYTEPHADGEVEVWYSAAAEVIRLQNGRVIATAGLALDWRAARVTPPTDWQRIPAEGLAYARELDQMPGYRYGVRQSLLLRPIATPADVPLLRARAAELSWFEETPVGASAGALPPVRFGVDLRQTPPRVRYSEQCLSASRCYSFEPLPVTGAPAPPGAGS